MMQAQLERQPQADLPDDRSMTLTTGTLAAWRAVAETAAQQAGVLIRQKLAEPRELKYKGFRDPVTDADIASQQLITDLIRHRFPEHGFLAEEANTTLPTHGRVRWIIDPVDGTSNYSRGIPGFCVSIGVAVDGEVVVGVIYDPMLNELFSGARGAGCTLNGQPMAVSGVTALSDALISLDWGRERNIRQAMLTTLGHFAHEVRSVRAIGSSALALAWVAAGRFEAYLNFHLSPWDFAAGQLLLQEAGGRISTFADQPLPLLGNTSCLGANAAIHPALRHWLAQWVHEFI